MFGDAYDYIADKAANAYSTVQLSQNEYLTQVNGFATGLKTALGGDAQAAAELADKIVTAEADIVAATGNSAEAVQNAFNGIMKSNYTMLDNLQIGITPTKEGMQEVIDKVNEWNAAQGKATAYTIDNVADCQSAVIDYIDMVGMSGYASAEASKTLSGSMASMNAAWSNLLTGIADDNADFEQLIDNFVNSVATVAENLLPRIEIALDGVGQLIEELLPIIVAEIPVIVDTVLPDLLESGTQMLLTICNGIIEALPTLGETAYELIEKMLTSISENAGSVFESGSETLLGFIEGIADALPDLLTMAADAIVAMALALTEPDTLNNIIEAGIEILTSLIAGIVEALPKLLEAAPKILANLATSIISSIPRLLIAATEIVMRLAGFIIDALLNWKNLGSNFFDALDDSFGDVDWMSLGTNIIDGIWGGLKDGWDWLKGKVKKLANDLFGTAQDELDIHSPSRKFEWIGEMCIAGLDEPIEDYNPYDTLQNSMKANVAGLQASFDRTSFAMAGGPVMDYAAMGDELKGAINGAAVYLNGEKVGQLITPTVNNELADYTDRRI